MSELLRRFLTDIVAVITQSTGEVLTILFLITMTFGCLLMTYWFYNRRKFQNLTHQIPANVVKSYLDSIIQNSNSLKSSLFRGGGLDIGEGIPSVMPLQSLPTGNVGGPSQEELNRKIAEISSLRSQLSEKDNIISDLEKKLSEAKAAMGSGDQGEQIAKLMGEKDALNGEVKSLKDQLEKAKTNTGDPEASKKLEEVTKDRDGLKEKLSEYEIIEEDLANLKKLQEENTKLKEEIEKLKGGAPAPVAAAPAPAAPEPPAEEEEEDLEAAMAAAIGGPTDAELAKEDEGEQKSAEELLSEFEKMLG